MTAEDVASLPGFRRRIRVEAGARAVVALLEDDYHCMAVTLEHEAGVVRAVIPVMYREPWTTCPGAIAQLRETFAGRPLAEVTARADKQRNCTHLHDLAVLAASHADRAGGFAYDVRVSDPADGRRLLEIRRDDVPLMCWVEQDGVLVSPDSAAGRTLFTLRGWIAGLPGVLREPARLLQWAGIVAHGRSMERARLGSAVGMPPNCYTFQPERVASARRIGKIVDFSAGDAAPLDGVGAEEIARVRETGR